MKKVEFYEYINGRIYESHNGKIIFNDGLISKLNVCKDITYKRHEIKLDFEYKKTLSKTQGHVGLYKVEYIIHVNYPHLLYTHNDMIDVVRDMFKYMGINTTSTIQTSSFMSGTTMYNEFIRRRNTENMNYGLHTFEHITIPYMMYSEPIVMFGPEIYYM